jgi:hypothetical protein
MESGQSIQWPDTVSRYSEQIQWPDEKKDTNTNNDLPNIIQKKRLKSMKKRTKTEVK